ncbi:MULTISPECIES: SpoIIE family protein phosphatase [unclassified Streptomyces]|uniref:SpoIIE family protein phosphatase n=1 Tax=unclassified Streptomyces TaxID=2593676 RepID=UPI001F07BF70|nr:SpoIIE family protein phosphatase [Streptomyces sp. CB09001]
MLDERRTVLDHVDAEPALTGWSADEIRGLRMADVVVAPARWEEHLGHGGPVTFCAVLRCRDGSEAEVAVEAVRLPAGSEARLLLFAGAIAGSHVEDAGLAHALLAQDRVGVVMYDADLVITRTNLEPVRPERNRPRAESIGRGVRLQDFLVAEDAAAIEDQLRRVLASGEALSGLELPARRLGDAAAERVVSVSAFRVADPHGRVMGVTAVLAEVGEPAPTRQRLALLHSAAGRLGQSLDVTRNAQELTAILVPELADLAAVDLTDEVLSGDDLRVFFVGMQARRVAVSPSISDWPVNAHRLGDVVRGGKGEAAAFHEGNTILVADVAAWRAGRVPRDSPWDRGQTYDEDLLRLMFPGEAASAVYVPLFARGNLLGVLDAWRNPGRPPFSAGDVSLIEEIASRGSLSLDNARRYVRERRTTEVLQRSLLPPPVVRMAAVRTSGAYAPARTAAGTGGCWYDVVRLSGVRTAFVVGKVAGHGIHAAGAMGRLRSAVQTLADLDPPPEEMLSHLDDMVLHIGEDENEDGHEPEPPALGSLSNASCLYATYDPITGQCQVATAGGLSAAVVRAGSATVDEIRLHPGPPLGDGTQPFETAELLLQPGDVLALSSSQLNVEHIRDGVHSAAAHGDLSVTGLTDNVLARLRDEPRHEDQALLLAHVERIPPARTAFWQLSADPALVARARELVNDQLVEWDLEDMAFSTELIVSELITNAIRYAHGPVGVRLVNDHRLVCEVSDPSQSQPHLRRARLSDEGGRGLFLIAQFCHRWGSRYTPNGKTIWTEQLVDAG